MAAASQGEDGADSPTKVLNRSRSGVQLGGSTSSVAPAFTRSNSVPSLREKDDGTTWTPTKAQGLARLNGQQLLKLSNLFDRTAKMNTDEAFQDFKRRLPAVLAAAQSKCQAPQPGESMSGALESFLKETQTAIADGVKLPPDVLEAQQVAFSKALADTISKELTTWQDVFLDSEHMEALIAKDFSEKFSEGLLATSDGPGSDRSPWPEVSQECLEASVRELCLGLIVKNMPVQTLVMDSQVRHRFKVLLESELDQVIGGSVKEGSKLIEEAKTKHSLPEACEKERRDQFAAKLRQSLQSCRSNTEDDECDVDGDEADENKAFLTPRSEMSEATSNKPLAQLCHERVSEVVRQEIEQYSRSSISNPSRANLWPGGAGVLKKFISRMKEATSPLNDDLARVSSDMALAGSTLKQCKASADDWDLRMSSSDPFGRQISSGSVVPSERPDTERSSFDTARSELLVNLAAGQLQKAIEWALRWDARHPDMESSLVEVSCDHVLQESTESEAALVAPEFSSKLDGRAQSLLMQSLLERSCSNAVLSVERIEMNLEWVLGLLQSAPHEARVVSHLETARVSMTAALDNLSKGVAPQVLVEADSDVKRRVSKLARLASKGLIMLASSA